MRTLPLKIAILRQWPDGALEALAEVGDLLRPEGSLALKGEGAKRRLQTADAALVSPSDPLPADVLEAAPNLKWISSVGAGLNHIDLEACSRRGIVVANTPDATAEPTADLAFGLLLAAARRLPAADGFVREGRWGAGGEPFWGLDVHHRTLGIVGMGRIGRAIARRAHGFSMRILYHNRRPLGEGDRPEVPVEWRDLDTLLAESDFVILQAPLTPQTRRLIGARELLLMRRSAILVNTGRGGLIDEEALADALDAGVIAYAALDVFEAEPNLNPRLLGCRNLLLAPHIGTATRASRGEMLAQAVSNLRRMIVGGPRVAER